MNLKRRPVFTLANVAAALLVLGLILSVVISAPARQRRIDAYRIHTNLPDAGDDLISYSALKGAFPKKFAELEGYEFLDKHFEFRANASFQNTSPENPLIVIKTESIWLLDEANTVAELARINAACVELSRRAQQN